MTVEGFIDVIWACKSKGPGESGAVVQAFFIGAYFETVTPFSSIVSSEVIVEFLNVWNNTN
jgi:hypothetical protein